MPITSSKQFRAMQAAAHGKSNLGIPKKVAKEFIHETSHKKRKEFANPNAQHLWPETNLRGGDPRRY